VKSIVWSHDTRRRIEEFHTRDHKHPVAADSHERLGVTIMSLVTQSCCFSSHPDPKKRVQSPTVCNDDDDDGGDDDGGVCL